MTITKTLGAGAVGAALIAAPLFALAQDDDKNKSVRTVDETAVSISIADNGSVLVRGARVTDIDGSLVTAVTTIGDLDLTWRVDTDADTDFVESDGDGSDIDEIDEGHYVSFSGSLDTDEAAFSVNADTVRDWSIGDDDDNNGNGFGRFWNNFKSKWPSFHFFGNVKVDDRGGDNGNRGNN